MYFSAVGQEDAGQTNCNRVVVGLLTKELGGDNVTLTTMTLRIG
jgi:hypothetical protein